MVQLDAVIDLHTFSIVARDPRTGDLGAAVASREPRLEHNLRVDEHAEPVAELRRVYGAVVAPAQTIERKDGAAGLWLFGAVQL